MASAPPTCPQTARLVRLLNSGGPTEEWDRLTPHIESCAGCTAWLTAWLAGNQPNAVEAACREGSTARQLPDPDPNLLRRIQAFSDPTAACQPEPVLPPGTQRLGRYRILRELGQGGMGVVYEGEDPNLNRRVAIKVMRPTPGGSRARERFLREGRAVALLKHPRIVDIYDYGEAEGFVFLVMELLHGESLQDRLRRGPLEVREAVRILREVAEGLAEAHKRKLVHRDIKPSNVWLKGPRAEAIILDFGLVYTTNDDPLTNSRLLLGTPAYMSPEQARQEPVDERSDLFSLGVLAYEMLTGESPFQGRSTADILSAVLLHNPPAPATRNPCVPDKLSQFVLSLLAKDAGNRRPRTAARVVQALTPQPTRPRSDPVLPPVPPPTRPRTPWLPRVASLLLLVAVFGLGYRYIPWTGAGHRPPEDGKRIDEKDGPGDLVVVPPATPPAGPPEAFTNSVGMPLVPIRAGKYFRGRGPAEDEAVLIGEEPRTEVTLTTNFYLGIHEVTQKQYRQVRGLNPSQNLGDNLPVERVSYHDALAFIKKLNDLPEEKQAGRTYRLPTAAEWEYCCRAGATTQFSSGQTQDDLARIAVFRDHHNQTQPVGSKAANAWGLYDMHGNVWEWTADWYDEQAYEHADPVDPRGPEQGTRRELRGGSFFEQADYCRAAIRYNQPPDLKIHNLGFRVACDVARKPTR